MSGGLAHNYTVELDNGADLTLHLESPPNGTSIVYDPTQPVVLSGRASIGLGHPDVAYIYILDVSRSTRDGDGDCGTVLECVQKFFIAFNKQAIEDGSAQNAGVISFHTEAQTETDGFLPPSDPRVEQAIQGVSNLDYGEDYGTGATICSEALQLAADLVEEAKATVETTIVVFAGDGLCTTWTGKDDPEDLHDATVRLEQTGAIIHTVAVGENVNCKESLSEWDGGNVTNDMDLIPRNGGDCWSVQDPDDLTGIIDDLLRSTITNVEYKVDDGIYLDIPQGNLTAELPMDGAQELNFTRDIGLLGLGEHEVCVRVKATSALAGDVVYIEDCHDITVEQKPTPKSPGKVGVSFAIIATVLLVGAFVLFWYFKKPGRTEKEDEFDIDVKPVEGGQAAGHKPEIV